MGSPMARRLIDAGHDVLVNDHDPRRAAEVADPGGRAGSLETVGVEADVVITMLPNSAVVRTVLLGVDGLSSRLRPDTLVIEMSSGDPLQTRSIAAELAATGIRLVDAPVSGGVSRAITGDLAVMVGGTDEDARRAAPYLGALGSSTTRTGNVGSAHAMKALNNLCSAGGFLIGIEVLLIGRRFGLAPETMVDVLNSSTGMNNSTRKKFKQFVLSGAFDSAFGLDLQVKDMRIALGIAEASGVDAPFAAACLSQWEQGLARLGPGRDHTEMARASEDVAGITLR